MQLYYPCCGKNICRGCENSFRESGNGNIGKCPFCNSDRAGKTNQDIGEDITKRVEANDAFSICLLAHCYSHGLNDFQQDRTQALELYARAAKLGCSEAHSYLGLHYYEGGNMKKAKFHFEAAAMAGNEVARYNIGCLEYDSGNVERALKHWMIAASAGYHKAMHNLKISFEKGEVSRESIDSTLAAYNNSCVDMRSKARDAAIHDIIE